MQARYFVLEPAAENGHGRASRAALVAYAEAIATSDRAEANRLLRWAKELGEEEPTAPSPPEERVNMQGVLELLRMGAGKAVKGRDGAQWAPVSLQTVQKQTGIPLVRLDTVVKWLEVGKMYDPQDSGSGMVRMEDRR